MTSQDNQRKIYIRNTKQWVPVTEEVYLEYYSGGRVTSDMGHFRPAFSVKMKPALTISNEWEQGERKDP